MQSLFTKKHQNRACKAYSPSNTKTGHAKLIHQVTPKQGMQSLFTKASSPSFNKFVYLV
jgi:hypothetical protein